MITAGTKIRRGRRGGYVRTNLEESDPEHRPITVDIKRFARNNQREVFGRLTNDKPTFNAPLRSTATIRDAPQGNGGKRNLIEVTDDLIDSLPLREPTRLIISTVSAEYLVDVGILINNENHTDPHVFGGLNNIRMGSTNTHEPCGTCARFDCPGHPGYIVMKTPIIDPIRWRVVINVLKCICLECSSLLQNPEDMRKIPGFSRTGGNDRLTLIATESEKSRCRHTIDGEMCAGGETPKYMVTKSKGVNHVEILDRGDTVIITPAEIYQKFNILSDEVVRYLGFSLGSHPRDLIITHLGVPPPVARPPVIIDDDVKPDKMTQKYAEIIIENNKFGNPNTKPEVITSNLYDLINQIKTDADPKSGSLATRLRKKEGMIRNNMEGKRTNYIFRAVISPDNSLRIDQVGIQLKAAKSANIPETIDQFNYQHISNLFNAGRITKWIPSHGPHKGRKISVNPGSLVDFRIGDEVERWLQDGDPVVFNRQPSLHRYSMLGYYAKILDMDGKERIEAKQQMTIRLHPNATTPHNADFDGDTANIMVPRSRESRKEVEEMMSFKNNIVSESQGRLIAAQIMDNITSAYLLTRAHEGVNPIIFQKVLERINNPPSMVDLQERAAKYGLHPFSGRTLFSALFRPNFFYKKGNVVIIDGILLDGRLTKEHLGTSHRSIPQDIHKQYGAQETVDFLSNAAWLLIAWLDTFGFSIGPADCDYGDHEESKLAKKKEFEQIYAKLISLENIPERNKDTTHTVESQAHEDDVQQALDHIKLFGKNLAAKFMADDPEHYVYGRQNAIGIMSDDVGSGAKTNLVGIGRMGGAMGQQFYDGVRMVPRGSETRFLPTQPFRENNKEVEAPPHERGYVRGSLWNGLSPNETFAILWGGRQSLVDTAKSVGKVGTFQRDLSKAVVGLVYGDDGTVRSTKGAIYSFSHGGDGLNVADTVAVDTVEYGRISQPFDVETMIEMVNAEEGWIKEQYFEKIEKNENLHLFIEADLNRRTTIEKPAPKVGTFEYGVPYAAKLLAEMDDLLPLEGKKKGKGKGKGARK